MVAVTSAAPAPEESSSSPTRRQKSIVRLRVRVVEHGRHADTTRTCTARHRVRRVLRLSRAHRLPASPRPTLGVEWELALVDKTTRDLSNRARRPLRRGRRDLVPDPTRLHKELLRNTVEVVTGVCDTVERGDRDLRDTLERRAAGRRRARASTCSAPAPTRSRAWSAQQLSRGPPLRGADQPHPVVGPADADLGRPRARRHARAGAGDAGAVVAAQPLPAPAGAVGVVAGLGRHRHRLRLQPGADVPAAADRRAAVPVRDLGGVRGVRPATS